MLATNIDRIPAPARLLGGMPVGSLVRDARTTYGGEAVVWQVADINHPGYPEDSVTLISHKILSIRPFDAKEASNPDGDCAKYGNNRYAWSNMRSWANSRAQAGEWYVPAHGYDEPPVAENVLSSDNPYFGEAGFLKGFSVEFTASMMPTDLTAVIPKSGSNELDRFTDRIFLPSMAEMGLVNYSNVDEGSRLAIFSDNASRMAYPTEYCVLSSTYKADLLTVARAYGWWLRSAYTKGSTAAYFASQVGLVTNNNVYNGTIGFRPLCNLPGKTWVSLEADALGVSELFV